MELRLPDERLEEIKERVVNRYEKFDINCVPISAFEIATKMGIKIISYSAYSERIRALMLKESKDGFKGERDSGEFYLFYNDEKIMVEQTTLLCMKSSIIVLLNRPGSFRVPYNWFWIHGDG